MSIYKRCDICHKKFSEYPNNPSPFSGRLCCDKCNNELVIPIRIYESLENPRTAMVFKTNGTLKQVKPKDGHFTTKELKTLVRGKFAVYPHEINNHLIICNERVIQTRLGENLLFHQYARLTLVSDIVLCPKSLFDGMDVNSNV